ncbi:hypothetical protein BXZ70DRAFT_956829 [Cristinia sonorae]|uniref:WD40 repeat-like protein n=1 Tax=Cristinia sonorae TaxID=1940300 RepID=A0A8K0UFU6_9AGAR|nr:hypothetical protein BXZ70DRAFT_956829 [Cristinia sonorae]
MTFQIAVCVDPSPATSTFDLGVSEGRPSCFASWFSTPATVHDQARTSQHSHEVAIGTRDGSVFLFRSSHMHPNDNGSHIRVISAPASGEPSSRPASPRYPGLGRRSVRSASPSSVMSTFSPLQVSKSRVVSAVSTEQVEAPKNYVDYDDEPEKLKGMLRGKGPKDKPSIEAAPSLSDKASYYDTTGKGLVVEKLEQNQHNPSNTLIITSPSKESSPRSSFSSSSQGQRSEASENSSLSLVSHIIPRNCTSGAGVVSLQAVHHGRILITLREDGDIVLISVEDGATLAAFLPEHEPVSASVPIIWKWKSLQTLSNGDYTVVLATASPIPTTSNTQFGDPGEGDSDEQTRLIALEFQNPETLVYRGSSIAKIGDWIIYGPAEGVTLYRSHTGTLELVHVTSSGHFIRQPLDINDYPLIEELEENTALPNVHLPIPNPFKALTNRSAEDLAREDKEPSFERISLGYETEFGAVALHSRTCGIRLFPTANGLKGLVWSQEEISGFECNGDSLRNLFSFPVHSIARHVEWKDDRSFLLVFSDHAEEYALINVDANGNQLAVLSEGIVPRNIQPRLVHSTTLLPSDAYAVTPSGDILTTRTKSGRRRIETTSLSSERNQISCTLFRSTKGTRETPFRISSILPLALDHLILGFSDGHVYRSTLSETLRLHERPRFADRLSDIALSGCITTLHIVDLSRSSRSVLLGGSDDGGIAIWSLGDLKLLARWIVFTTPLIEVIPLIDGRLRDCAICAASDGTIAVIAVDEMQFLFLAPASVAPLSKICLGEDNLLVYSGDGRARLWDIKTREHWRTMNAEKADEMVKAGGWRTWNLSGKTQTTARVVSSLAGGNRSLDAAATIVLDIEMLLAQVGISSPPAGTKTTNTDGAITIEQRQTELRAVLSTLLTPGLNSGVDHICSERLKIPATSAALGSVTSSSVSLNPVRNSCAAWSVSSDASAVRAMGIISVLHAYMQCSGTLPDVDTVMAFYTASLPEVVGDQFKPPDLSFLAGQWLQTPVNAIRVSARALLDAGIVRMNDDDTTALIERWKDELPTLNNTDKDQLQCAIALFICGSVAVGNYALLSTANLTQIAKSIALYLHEETSPYRALAIDLCSRGFQVWQQYVDAVQMLRALFTLSTTTKKEAISVQNVGQLARTAVLQIAASNTPLFMTTLSLDILNPGSVQHRKSVMQLVIFLIRKKPLVLYSNLPRLVEAVVKSLDPNASNSREAILDSATEILGHIVLSFPSVDFHMASQRLAVGTSEGSVVMYDLKTATRLYVLEGHKKRTTACSFSPDGRRLVTVSLEEFAVLVWKVGSSFSSFFNPGAPPRQGHGGTEPFKTLSFNIGDEVKMSLEATLELVRFEWPSDRSVKLKIRESVLTFST